MRNWLATARRFCDLYFPCFCGALALTETTIGNPLSRPSWRDAVRGNVLAMGLVSLFTDFSSEMMNPLLPIFIAGLVGGLKAAFYVGLMEGIAETTASLLKIYSGRISDKTGKRKALVLLGYGASALSRPLMALAGLVIAAAPAAQVVVLKFLDRVGKGIRTSPRDALIGDSVPKEVRGLAFSFHRSMDHLGSVLGPLAAIGIAYWLMGDKLWTVPAIDFQNQTVGGQEMHALRWLFAIALVPGLAAIAAIALMVKEIVPKGQSKGPELKKAGLLPRKFWVFVSVVGLFALGNSSDMFIMLLGATAFGMSMLKLLVLWAVFHVSKIAFSIPGGILSDKLGRRPIIIAGWLMYAVVYMLFALVTQEWQFWALMLAYGFYFGMAEGSEKALVADFVPSEQRGTAFGVYAGAVGIAALPASLVFGIFWAQIGPRWAFGIGATLAGLAAILLMLLLSTDRKKVSLQ
jgi:MFS family permease